MKTKIFLFLLFVICCLSFVVSPSYASNLINASDTISTSSPSALAMHTIKFKTLLAVPTSGKITITFPALASGDSNNPASPSASTFQLNGLSGVKVKILGLLGDGTFSALFTNPSSGTAPVVNLTLSGSTNIQAGATITIFLGCTGTSGSTCITPSATILNPSKPSLADANIWKVTVNTKTSSDSALDQAKLNVATNPSVQIQAKIDPTLTFTISGTNAVTGINNSPVNSGNTLGCTNTEFTTTGVASTATTVDLGKLTSSNINISAQLVTVTTNAPSGYSITATSSGHLRNATNGSFINDSLTPQPITAGIAWFGVHACGIDVPSIWGSGSTGGGAGAKYGWPTPSSSLIIAKATKGPVNGVTTVEYASTIDNTVTGGTYSTTIIYTVLPTF